MLQKLENAYLAILRFVVLAVAGLLLVSVVLLGMNATGLLKQQPAPVKANPQVNVQEVISASTEKSAAPSSSPSTQATTQSDKQPNPLQPEYDRAVNAIAAYGAKLPGGPFTIDHSRVVQILKSRVADLKEPGHEEAYIKGLADTLTQALTTPAVTKSATFNEPFKPVDSVINNYIASFNAQIDETNAKNEMTQREYQFGQASSLQSLYYAAGGFGAFLLVVLLSVIIRIERNLRHLERIPAQSKTATPAPQRTTPAPEQSQAAAS